MISRRSTVQAEAATPSECAIRGLGVPRPVISEGPMDVQGRKLAVNDVIADFAQRDVEYYFGAFSRPAATSVRCPALLG